MFSTDVFIVEKSVDSETKELGIVGVNLILEFVIYS